MNYRPVRGYGACSGVGTTTLGPAQTSHQASQLWYSGTSRLVQLVQVYALPTDITDVWLSAMPLNLTRHRLSVPLSPSSHSQS